MKKFVIPGIIRRFSERFHANGFRLFIVGGAVRDYYAGKRSTDYDFATDALPRDVQRIFRRTIPTGIEHGTVTVLFGKHAFEVTTFRSDGTYSDARHPDEVTFAGSIHEDLARRDFTINALAVDTFNGELIDAFDGLADLRQKIIRAIGTPDDRFREDSLRMLRAFRFAAQHDLTIEPNTLTGISAHAAAIQHVSAERIREELNKILTAPAPSATLFSMQKAGILNRLLPELTACIDVGVKGPHRIDTFTHLCRCCDYVPRENLTVRWAALLHDIGKPGTAEVAESGELQFHRHEQLSAKLSDAVLARLKAPNALRKSVVHLIRHHMFNYTPEWSDAAVRRFIHRIGVGYYADIITLRIADIQGSVLRGHLIDTSLIELMERVKTVLAAGEVLSIRDLQVNGNDLIELGIPKGPAIGLLLELLLEAVLDDQSLNTTETLLPMARSMYHTYHLD